MNITVTLDLDNIIFNSFDDFEKFAYNSSLKLGQNLIKKVLELKDRQLMAKRDMKRFRCKGLRKTCIKTVCGTVEYSRRIYDDLLAQSDEPHSRYLLDESMGLEKIGNVSPQLCKLVASSVCESSYRAAARQINELTGQNISTQGAWNIVQKIGKRQKERTERNSELAKESQGTGSIETKILYEENDGIWLHLQKKSRLEHGRSKEMKVGIAYDGVLWKENKEGTKKRRILNNKLAYAGFEKATEFRKNKEGLVASLFDVDSIDLRVLNGDGAAWIKKQKGVQTITVLDEYHRNKKIRECIKNQDLAEKVRKYVKEMTSSDELLETLRLVINSVAKEDEEGVRELYRYYEENKESLQNYYDRGIDIPPTREPGVLHHARLGSMESNIFTLIGNRMKGRRCNWSIAGANNIASILCAYHTVGMNALFEKLPNAPEKEEEWVDTGSPLSGSKIGETIGHGYEYPVSASTQTSAYWLKDIAKLNGLDSLKLSF